MCGKSRCWYCPDCLCSLCPDQQPRVALPFNVRIITHPEEKRSKSTGLQAKLLCPSSVELIEFDEVPTETDLSPSTAALLFPSTDAVCPQDMDVADVKTIYIIDRFAHLSNTIFYLSERHAAGMVQHKHARSNWKRQCTSPHDSRFSMQSLEES